MSESECLGREHLRSLWFLTLSGRRPALRLASNEDDLCDNGPSYLRADQSFNLAQLGRIAHATVLSLNNRG